MLPHCCAGQTEVVSSASHQGSQRGWCFWFHHRDVKLGRADLDLQQRKPEGSQYPIST